ncbi:hypothetical protein [Gloeothece verrucosa]|uniref:Uncharacterized protein n=1 Tax=Gloeothece verrucosa (strain PCC 7822) TaxID=497965 RepID=E0UJG7_GLOV7|nr:hypothetical protein [Gloeothece verrucosa]ADN16985.1 hypothetical protein Cyan7822_5100 [Gloeothece verrucosa PCC 7822]
MKTTSRSTATRQMHQIIWILLGVFSLLAITFPIAMFRVSQKEAFSGFHLKSLNYPEPAEKPSNPK